jgi:hypothetical protein
MAGGEQEDADGNGEYAHGRRASASASERLVEGG